jgi:hypothetical protein
MGIRSLMSVSFWNQSTNFGSSVEQTVFLSFKKVFGHVLWAFSAGCLRWTVCGIWKGEKKACYSWPVLGCSIVILQSASTVLHLHKPTCANTVCTGDEELSEDVCIYNDCVFLCMCVCVCVCACVHVCACACPIATSRWLSQDSH